MTDLTKMKCEACRFDAPKVSEAEKLEYMVSVPSWTIRSVEGVERLRRVFKLKNYTASVNFTQQIAEMAELEDHHPLIVLEWGQVTVEWWSHKIKGLHRNDFISAAKTDELFSRLS